MRISSVSFITSLHITLLYILGNFQYTHRKKERKQKHIYVYFLISNYFLTSTYLLSIILYVKNVFYRSFQDFLNRSNYIVTTILVIFKVIHISQTNKRLIKLLSVKISWLLFYSTNTKCLLLFNTDIQYSVVSLDCFSHLQRQIRELRYMGPKVWSPKVWRSVPSNVKKASTLSSFKYNIRKVDLSMLLDDNNCSLCTS